MNYRNGTSKIYKTLRNTFLDKKYQNKYKAKVDKN